MSDNIQAYCVKCKTKREMQDAQAVYTKTGTPGTRGQCSVCGTNLFRMGATEAHAHIPKPEKVEKPKRSKAKKKSKSASKRSSGKLVIVESPAKARSIGSFLGNGYTVLSSKGHIRDLLKSRLSVDTEHDFAAEYRVPNDKRQVVKELKSAVSRAEEVYLATDLDREGEAIAWHLIAAAEIPENIIKRVVFHEITDEAVKKAFSEPRDINMDLVNAQQARRILDRLVGYNLSPLLWKRVRNGLSAGRVQSIALRIVVDRETEIDAFVPEEYWTLDAQLKRQTTPDAPFVSRLVKINDADVAFRSEGDVRPHLDILEKSLYIVDKVKRGTRQRKPSAPFTTSTLQQDASRRLGFNARRTMTAAQKLYEGIELESGNIVGLITYMRTDSVQVSKQAQDEAQQYIHDRFGKEFTPAKPPVYKTRSKGAQEAHEAVRPTKVLRSPTADLKRTLDAVSTRNAKDLYRLYKLIWERFVASQMSNAVYDTVRVEIKAGINQEDTPYLFRASGSKIKFSGFLALYEETRDEDAKDNDQNGNLPPELTNKELLDLVQLLPEQHFTQPPPRYTEASLVRTLEEHGIGRPSTYAPIVTVIQNRDYVTKEDKRLVPTDIGKTVSNLLVEFFPTEMDYQFTARMEEHLDDVSEGSAEWKAMLHEFYSPFEKRLENAQENMPSVQQIEHIGRDCPECGNELIMRHGRRGKFIGCSNYPNCRHTEPYIEHTGIACPTCGDTEGGELIVRKSRTGRTFYGCLRYPDCDYSTWKLPKTPQKQDGEPTVEKSVLPDLSTG